MSEKNVFAILDSPHTNEMTAAMFNLAVHKAEQAGYAVTNIKQSRGAIRNKDEFFKTAGMKSIGKIVCANADNRRKLPKQTIKRIERCLK